MIRRSLLAIAVAVAGGVAGAALAAQPPAGWNVGKTDDSPPTFSRTLDSVTVEYHFLPGEYDWIQLTVDPCGSGPWHIKDDIDPPGDTVSQHGYYVRKVIAENFRNARLNCKISDDIETRMMDGYDAAYAQFETLKTHAQTH